MKELMEVYKESLRKLQERHAKLVQEIHVYDKRVALLEEEMERVVTLSVPLTAQAHWGKNWLEAKG